MIDDQHDPVYYLDRMRVLADATPGASNTRGSHLGDNAESGQQRTTSDKVRQAAEAPKRPS